MKNKGKQTDEDKDLQKDRALIALDGGKQDEKTDTFQELLAQSKEFATLIVDGESVNLDSFVLSGENTEGKRVLLTWNSSLDQLCSYNAVLNIVVEDKIREALQ